MTERPSENALVHTRLLKCTLEVDSARAWWQRVDPDGPPSKPEEVFEAYWFGAKSLARIEVLVANFRLRFDAYPHALEVLHRWPDMDPATRTLICHWHLQLADPLYRAFAGTYLPERRASHRPELTRDRVVAWVSEHGAARWTMSTRIQFASKLLSSAHTAGLVQGTRDPRPLTLPRVPDDSLAYLMYLLRGVDFQGSLVDNPYVASVGLDDGGLEDRLRGLPSLAFRRQGDLVDFGWTFPGLREWAAATVQQAAS
ncbi:MAG: DUF1819 domain-containing protein [Myxococcota bacterium]